MAYGGRSDGFMVLMRVGMVWGSGVLGGVTWTISSEVQRVFFFQAEDGIRDVAVTGVQTCALPISMGVAAQILQHIFGTTKGTFQVHHPVLSVEWPQPGGEDLGLRKKLQVSLEVEQIGRASCRERV